MVDLVGKHTLTKESQEVMIRLRLASDVPSLSLSKITRIPARHTGQLNITISTLSAPMKSGVVLKSNMIVLVVVFSVSS